VTELSENIRILPTINDDLAKAFVKKDYKKMKNWDSHPSKFVHIQ